MADEDTLARSQRFRALQNDPTWLELQQDTIGDLFREWFATEPFDQDARERLFRTALAVRCLKDRLDRECGVAERQEAEAAEARRLEAEERERRIEEQGRGD